MSLGPSTKWGPIFTLGALFWLMGAHFATLTLPGNQFLLHFWHYLTNLFFQKFLGPKGPVRVLVPLVPASTPLVPLQNPRRRRFLLLQFKNSKNPRNPRKSKKKIFFSLTKSARIGSCTPGLESMSWHYRVLNSYRELRRGW